VGEVEKFHLESLPRKLKKEERNLPRMLGTNLEAWKALF